MIDEFVLAHLGHEFERSRDIQSLALAGRAFAVQRGNWGVLVGPPGCISHLDSIPITFGAENVSVLDLWRKKERARISVQGDPREGQKWFDNLTPKMRSELTDDWRGEQERMLYLTRRARNQVVGTCLQVGLLFVVFDLLSVGVSPTSILVMLGAGVLTGLVWTAVDATRLSAPAIAVLAFGAALLLTRGATQQHFFGVFLLAGITSWIGARRETRAFD